MRWDLKRRKRHRQGYKFPPSPYIVQEEHSSRNRSWNTQDCWKKIRGSEGKNIYPVTAFWTAIYIHNKARTNTQPDSTLLNAWKSNRKLYSFSPAGELQLCHVKWKRYGDFNRGTGLNIFGRWIFRKTYHQLAVAIWTWKMKRSAKQNRAPVTDWVIFVDVKERAGHPRWLVIDDDDDFILTSWVGFKLVVYLVRSISSSLFLFQNKWKLLFLLGELERWALLGTSSTSAATSCRSFHIWGKRDDVLRLVHLLSSPMAASLSDTTLVEVV